MWPGLDCIVKKDHEVIFRHFSGMSDRENDKKMQGDELYLIFSMTKMITCVAALMLFEKGKYKMDDPLSKYLPEFEKMKIAHKNINMETAKKITTGVKVEQTGKVSSDEYAINPIRIIHLFTILILIKKKVNQKVQSGNSDGMVQQVDFRLLILKIRFRLLIFNIVTDGMLSISWE